MFKNIFNYLFKKENNLTKENVYGDINFEDSGITELPLLKNKVTNSLYLYKNNLVTLQGCPKEVGEIFDCSYNKLKSLKDSPKVVGSHYYCNNNKLKKFENTLPEKISGKFDCSYNKLKTLEGSPKIILGRFRCFNNKLKTLEGGPEFVDGDYDCNYNKLKTLKGCAKEIKGWLYFEGNEKLNVPQVLKEIIEFQIKAQGYSWDTGYFTFEDIREPFEKYGESKC